MSHRALLTAFALAVALTPAPAAAAPVELTMAEVATHDRVADCWMVIEGAVYDVTAFIAGHPGGEKIVRGCGKDATRFFRQRDAAGGHSAGAEAILGTFRLGVLGETVAVEPGETPPGPHPHDLRGRSRWVGLLGTVDASPPWSLDVHVKHHLVTDPDDRSRIGVILGLGLWDGLDLQLGDITGDGVSHVEAKWGVFDRDDPVALAISAGAEFLRVEDDDAEPVDGAEPVPEEDRGPPSIYAQVALEREMVDRVFAVRLNALGFVQPGYDEGVALGAGLEVRPDPLYGVFAEGVVPLLDDPLGTPIWCIGARLYTLGHHFGLYIASTPTASVTPLAGRPPKGTSAGFSIARAFAL